MATKTLTGSDGAPITFDLWGDLADRLTYAGGMLAEDVSGRPWITLSMFLQRNLSADWYTRPVDTMTNGEIAGLYIALGQYALEDEAPMTPMDADEMWTETGGAL